MMAVTLSYLHTTYLPNYSFRCISIYSLVAPAISQIATLPSTVKDGWMTYTEITKTDKINLPDK